MQYFQQTTPKWGRVLWVTHGIMKIGVALDFGIRVVHLSCTDCENLFYEQPLDRSDGFTTPGGWKLYGGHRLWLAPESDDSYFPDNSPVDYFVNGDVITFLQEPDSLLQVRKSLTLHAEPDGSMRVIQKIENTSNQSVTGAAWGVNTLDAGGTAHVSFENDNSSEFNPTRVLSLWSDTSLGDPRIRFEKDRLTATHMPIGDYFKIGLYCRPGYVTFSNKGQKFVLTFAAKPYQTYPDNGCNFELYMCKQFMELESLGEITTMLPGQCAAHEEVWRVEKYI